MKTLTTEREARARQIAEKPASIEYEQLITALVFEVDEAAKALAKTCDQYRVRHAQDRMRYDQEAAEASKTAAELRHTIEELRGQLREKEADRERLDTIIEGLRADFAELRDVIDNG